MLSLPPFLLFYLAACVTLLTRGNLRRAVLVATPLLGALNLYYWPEGSQIKMAFLFLELMPMRIDALSLMFGYLFHIAALIGIVFALHIKDTLQQVSSLLYAGSALGAVFAGDLLSFFIFWEGLAISSVFLIWARRTPESYSAGLRYLIIQVVSGLMLLLGLSLYWQDTGQLDFNQIGTESVFGWCILFSLGIKAAFPLLHSWLTDAYPEATPTGAIFLCAFTTKVAIYALARGFPGTELLVYVGAIMACFPIFFALIENDLRRVLAYSMINQLGFMVVGVGIGTPLALNGAVAHVFTDVIFKGLLFMCMGAVLHMTGKINATELGGLYKTMPKTTLLCLIGTASVSALPLFSGFVSKSMIMSAVLDADYDGVWLALLFASAGAFYYAGVKILYRAFFSHDSGIRAADPPSNMLLAMTIAAALCIAIGVFPELIYQALPFEVSYSPYDITHVLTQLQLLLFAALAFVWLNKQGLYPPELNAVHLDVDWSYRRLLPQLGTAVIRVALRFDGAARSVIRRQLVWALAKIEHKHRPGGLMSRPVTTGTMVGWVTLILALYLLVLLI